ncbi:MAG: twin-arginine translocase subunit TatC [Chloroflexi bacterium]|nr:twin-arginine translocase subunit TatC [Chloroflexota bacterium]
MAGQEESRLTLREHLEELRKRLFVAALAVALGTVVAFVLHREILKLLMEPADDLLSGTDAGLIYTNLTENLGVSMKVSLLGGFILALPVVVYELVMFIAPGLTPRERRYLLMFLPAVVITFALGVLFGYFIMLPPALRFLLTFDADIATPMIRVGNYMGIVTRLLFWLGMVFEIPILIFLLAKLRLVNHRMLARRRRIAVILAFVLGAMITPTFDPINQTLVAIPIVLLYEAGIWLAWLARRGEKSSSVDVTEAPDPSS